MDKLKISIFVFAAIFLAGISAYAQETLLLRSPSISDQHVAFVYGGDIWVAERDGTNARRLTVNPAFEQNPVFSPDGQQLAFTGNYDGNTDVYVISIQGGEPRRGTHHPAADVVRGWMDNEKVYFTSTRDFQYALSPRLNQISTKGGVATPLVMPQA